MQSMTWRAGSAPSQCVCALAEQTAPATVPPPRLRLRCHAPSVNHTAPPPPPPPHCDTVAGTGLGLPVAKKMAEAMGGGLTLERDAARGVTVFTLRLPLFPGVDDPSLIDPHGADGTAHGGAAIAVAAAGRVQVSPLNMAAAMPSDLAGSPHDTLAPVVRLLQACDPPIEPGLAHGVALADLVEPAGSRCAGAAPPAPVDGRRSVLSATSGAGGSIDERSALEVLVPATPLASAVGDKGGLLPLVPESKQSPIVTSGGGGGGAGGGGSGPMPATVGRVPPPPVLLPMPPSAGAGGVVVMAANAAPVGRVRTPYVPAAAVATAPGAAPPAVSSPFTAPVTVFSAEGSDAGAEGSGATSRSSPVMTRAASGSPPSDTAPKVGGAAAAPPAQPLGLHVLYADDEAINCRIMARMLERLGCTCVCVSDGADVHPALAATGQLPGVAIAPGRPPAAVAAARRYDVVLLDLMMRGQGGLATCRLLRDAGVTEPIVACTGDAEAAGKPSAGFTACLSKPFTVDKLEGVLRAVLGR
jgi:CheY-like chemotaxis protein